MGATPANGGRVRAAPLARRAHFRQLARWPRFAALATLALLLPASVLAADAQIAALVDSPDPVAAGGLYSYTMRVDNNAVDASTNTRLTFTVPANAALVSASPALQNCAPVSATTVQCDLGSLGPFGADVRNIVLTWRATVAGPSVINATALLSADNDANPANNSQNATTTVIAGADLGLTKTGTPDPAIGGGPVTCTLSTRNTGPNDGGAMVITDNLPPSVGFVSASGSGSGRVCGRAGGAADPANSTNTAAVASDTPDPNTTNNSGAATVLVRPDRADLRLAKVKSPNPGVLGADIVSVITLTNGGPRAAAGPLRMVEAFNGEAFVSASGSGWVCVPSGAVVVCDHPNPAGLAVNAALPVLRITTQATSAGLVSNQACTGSSLPAAAGAASARPPAECVPDPGNDCVTANATSTTIRPDLAISKTTTTPSGGDKIVSVSEAAVTYTLVVGHVSPGADGATGARFTDAVPGLIVGRTTFAPFVSVVSAGNAVFACSASAAGSVTCTQSAGTLAPGETVTVPITVNRPLQDGAFTNTAVVSNSREGDPNSANNSASDTVLIEPIADVQMLPKTVLPTAMRAGENATDVISLRNNGPSPALNVRVSDSFNFPAGDTGFTVLSVSSPGLACALAAGGQISPASPTFSCTVGALANASAGSVTLVVRPNFMPGNPVRSIGNSAAISTDCREAPGGDASSAAAKAITIGNLPLAGSAGNHFAKFASNSAITGRVWLDANNDGLIDAAEAGIAGVAVTLTGTDSAGNALSRSTPTDATGNYRFDALAPAWPGW